ncbi:MULTISPECIES: DUF4149 domain-containing protein [Campylobacter]|uniref:DUF4149 domain-containing protein n=1 Tax=Campylobacter taeniopygiae TaxID=2510188 RepID=A0ABY2THN4_9BACT|nr:DUF4149 domain-containing protein [Campylobacter taeniopygiae]MBZ7935566.1 DUF4149 domain-containing protein [Campylobacter sp. B0100352/1]TKX33358.1 DUF4149 domain-containing protein [Campylobacter taeniopygiae]
MKAVNLFLLAAMIGIELILGIVVAPVIFYPQNFIGDGILSHYQSGILMTQIFIKMGYLLLIVSTINILFEIFSYFREKFNFKIKFSKLMLSLIILILSLVFVFYFTEQIISMQKLGEQATTSTEFTSIHSASEITLKIILVSQIFLYFLSFKIEKK